MIGYWHGKTVSVPSLMPEEQRLQRRRMRVIEEILLGEYNAVRAEFDQAKENPPSQYQVQATCERYMDVIRRLKNFLATGQIPADVERRL